MSSGEAELHSANKGAADAMGLRGLMNDLGIELDMRLLTDSSTAKAVILRRGLGKLRHIDMNNVWLQERSQVGDVAHVIIKKVFTSPARAQNTKKLKLYRTWRSF